jgi:hypothetical protein
MRVEAFFYQETLFVGEFGRYITQSIGKSNSNYRGSVVKPAGCFVKRRYEIVKEGSVN